MKNASRLDREIWKEFYGRWERLAETVATDVALGEDKDGEETQEQAQVAAQLTDVYLTRRTRRGQQFFRNSVVAAYEGTCCITGIANSGLLRASHIIPWSVASEERLNPSNGLCLNALHDAAFDRGLITVTPDLIVKVSSVLHTTLPAAAYHAFFEKYHGRPIKPPTRFTPSVSCLEYHNRHVFHE